MVPTPTVTTEINKEGPLNGRLNKATQGKELYTDRSTQWWSRD